MNNQQQPNINQSSPSQEPSAADQKSRIKFGLSIAIVAICLVAAAVAVYWIKTEPTEQSLINIVPKESTDQTASWQTYSITEDYGSIEFKYPKDFSISYEARMLGLGPATLSLSNFNPDWGVPDDQYGAPLTMYLSENQFYMLIRPFDANIAFSNGKDLKSWLLSNLAQEPMASWAETIQIIDEYKDLKGQLVSEKEISVNGKSAIQRVVSFTGKLSQINFVYTYVPFDKMIYQITSYSANSDILKIYDQILSTFKFTETVDTSNWQTYRNEEYGFEFRYPAMWGSPEVNDDTLFSEEVCKQIPKLGDENCLKIAKKKIAIGFDGELCNDTFNCFVSLQMQEYSAITPLRLNCIDCRYGQYTITNILDEKEEINNNSNVYIGGLKGEKRDGISELEERLLRIYTVISPKYEIRITGGYSYSSGKALTENFVNTIGENQLTFLEKIIEVYPAVPYVADLKLFLENLNKVVSTFKFIK